jgi:hypothetical protein
MMIVLFILNKMNGVLCDLLLLLVNFINRIVEAKHVIVASTVVFGAEVHHIVFLTLQLPHILRLDYLHWELVQNAYVLVFNLAVLRFHMILLGSLLQRGRFEYHILASQSYSLILLRRVCVLNGVTS